MERCPGRGLHPAHGAGRAVTGRRNQACCLEGVSILPILAGRGKSEILEYGAVTWPGEIDLAPDAMYEEIKQNGTWALT
jgi:hypothetical protein